jgi:hypothetical protein
LRLIRKKYSGTEEQRFGPTLAAEHLASTDGLEKRGPEGGLMNLVDDATRTTLSHIGAQETISAPGWA